MLLQDTRKGSSQVPGRLLISWGHIGHANVISDAVLQLQQLVCVLPTIVHGDVEDLCMFMSLIATQWGLWYCVRL
jgi:hypothetical protein